MPLTNVARYTPTAVNRRGGRAVVLGASMAGLAAARVLGDAFEEVILIERDPLPEEPATRAGAPQTSHPHVLLEAGRATLEDFFPGFTEDVIRQGGLLVDAATEMDYYDQGGFLADGPHRLPMLCASRALFEHVTRTHVRSHEAVQLSDECHVTDYLVADERGVTGVTYRDPNGRDESLRAELVVDATGRTSRTPTWLDEHGFPAPPVDEVTIEVTYSTIRIDRPPGERRVLFVPPSPPRTRGAAAIPIEDGQWEFILQGMHGDDTPTASDAFVAFADSLPVAAIGRLAAARDWRSDQIHHYPFPSSIRRRYETLDQFPTGLLVTGDAIASFNPIYGQGMSVGALDALVLHQALATGRLTTLAERYFQRVAPVIDQVWRIAVGADFAFPQTTGPKPVGTNLFNRYVSRLVQQAHTDGVLTDTYYRVFRLEQPTTALVKPSVVWRVLRP